MKANKFYQIFFLSAVAIAMSACVPKATEKKAVCGTNQGFNSVTRACVNIAELRVAPVATKSSEAMVQETAETITLSYIDGNNNQASSCKVTSPSAKIEAVSPQIVSGSIFAKADLVFYAAQDAASALPLAVRPAALLQRDAMTAALNIARTSFNQSIITNQLGLFRTAAINILTTASGYTGSSTSIQYYYTLTQTRLAEYDVAKVFVDNRCDCTGGICTTSIAPKMHQTGVAGFNYTVTDIDGESATKAVSLSIAAISGTTSFKKPAVESTYVTGAESNSNIPSTHAFLLGTARDYVGTSSFTYAHNKTVASVYFPSLLATKTYVPSDSGLGKITNCLGLGGSLSTDTSCLYIPNSGDVSSALVPAASTVTLNTDLTLTAKANGLAGDSISVVFKSINADLTSLDSSLSTTAEKYGLVGALDDVYIRVVGDVIYVVFNNNVTTTLEVANAINNDLVASTLVDASAGGASTPALVASASAGVSLAGGVAGYDTFSYTVSNGVATSTNTAKATIQITSTLDHPQWNPYPSTSSPLAAIDDTATSRLEAATALSMTTNVSTTYYDPDDVATTCTVSTDPLDLVIWSSGSNGLAGVTVAEVLKTDTDFAQAMPLPTCTITGVAPIKIITFSVDRADATKTNAFGTYALLFKVTDGATLTTSLPTFHGFKFTVSPVNDEPDATAIAWSTTTTNPTLTSTGTTFLMTTLENSSARPSTAYADITVDPDVTATGFETAQTVTVTADSDNETLLKDASLVVTSISATVKRVSFVTEANKSGSANITLTLTDNGGTAVVGDDNTSTQVIALTVTPVNDPPYIFSTITTIDTNEGGLVQSPGFIIEEDLGQSADEDLQDITITAIASDNATVLPTTAVTLFYDLNDNGVEDSGEERDLIVPEMLEDPVVDPSEDVGLHKFYLKLKPVAGVSGNANVTLTISDGTNSITNNFSLIVHPVAALHGGWANISAIGIKSDKNGAPASADDIECNYNKNTDTKACDTNQTCTGTSAPHGVKVPDAVNVLFWDSASKKCYRSQSTSKFSWVDVTTSCPVTRIFVSPTTLTTAINSVATSAIVVGSTTGFPAAGVITIGTEQISYTAKTATTFAGTITRAVNSTTAAAHTAADVISYSANGENFIKDTGSTPVTTTPVPTGKNQYYLDANTKSCYGSEELTVGTWSWSATAYVPSKVTLTWNAFTVTGYDTTTIPVSSVQTYGWNVYRREAGEDYDYKSGFLKIGSTDTMSISDATTKTFTDTTAVAGKVYYYLVRPVDSTSRHLTISTPEIFSEVRVLAPVPNYAFVHRWMMNQEICNSMHKDTMTTEKVDPTRNYRCPYRGPGEGTGASAGHYDIGKDMLVDISETSCPYSPAPECTASGCIGIGTPAALALTATSGSVYYDRNAGSCWYNNAGTWVDSNSGAGALLIATKNLGTALNPPLVNITKANAELVCNNRSTASAVSALALANAADADANAPTVHSLPSKKEYIAYSAAPYAMTDSLVTDLEQGFSLNVQSRCNSSNANGIDSAFTDSNIPSTSFIYSLPGTASSGIRSLYTGSVPWGSNLSTESCSSRYGVQDVFGNVGEWVKDSMSCAIYQNSTLNGGIDAVTTTVVVVSTAGFAATNIIAIDSEYLTITSVDSATQLTVTRASGATIAAAHLTASPVLLVNNNNFVCTTVTGTTVASTDLGRYNFATGLYDNAATTQYAFDLLSGPYNDVNASSTATIGDGFLTEWDFRDELFGAGKFNFPMGMPMNVDIASTSLSASPAIAYLLDIGPTAGITTAQLHEDGIIVNGDLVNDKATNTTQTGSFVQGGSYLSGNRSGRYSSELVPDTMIGPDIGFRCYIPIDTLNFPSDPLRHTYSY